MKSVSLGGTLVLNTIFHPYDCVWTHLLGGHLSFWHWRLVIDSGHLSRQRKAAVFHNMGHGMAARTAPARFEAIIGPEMPNDSMSCIRSDCLIHSDSPFRVYHPLSQGSGLVLQRDWTREFEIMEIVCGRILILQAVVPMPL